jgi:phosphoribosylamine-glycine ligase
LSLNQLFFARQLNNTHNNLLLGSGGRERTFTWKMVQNPLIEKTFFVAHRCGTTNLAMESTDFETIKAFAKVLGMVVVGPEDPLVKGFMISFIDQLYVIFNHWSFKNGRSARG